eukprot:1449486-Amphidinium_carterae.1
MESFKCDRENVLTTVKQSGDALQHTVESYNCQAERAGPWVGSGELRKRSGDSADGCQAERGCPSVGGRELHM